MSASSVSGGGGSSKSADNPCNAVREFRMGLTQVVDAAGRTKTITYEDSAVASVLDEAGRGYYYEYA